MNVKLLLSQVNCMTPSPLQMNTLSIENDFSFVEKMFWKTNVDIQQGIGSIDEVHGNNYLPSALTLHRLSAG